MSGSNYVSERGKEDYGPTTVAIARTEYPLHLRIECYSWLGDGETVIVDGICGDAQRQVDRLRNRTWNGAWAISNTVVDKCADLV
jgi:hypothetical protein